MDKKLTKIAGLKKDDFDEFVSSGELKLREARLIPFFKPGDEMALTSVILSSIRLINEFRKKIFSDSKLIGGVEDNYENLLCRNTKLFSNLVWN